MKSPKHLSHKPIISVNDYDKIDAFYAKNTDVRALSIGKAQYDQQEISLKVWRHTGKKWSRQSEELPIHRNLDLSILFLVALSTDNAYPQSFLPNRNEKISFDTPEDTKAIKNYYEKHKEFLEPRLLELKQILNNFYSNR